MFSYEKKPGRGIIFILASVVLGLMAGLLIKKTAVDTNLVTTLFYRFVFSVPLLLLFSIIARGKKAFKISQKKTMATRIVFGFLGMVFWVLAIRNLPLGLAAALFQSSVIFVTMLSPILLQETVGIYRWSSVLLGLAGIFLLTDPFSESVSFEITYGFLAALSGALLSISLRRLGKADHSLSVALIYNASAALVIILFVIISPASYFVGNVIVLRDLIFLGLITSFSQIFFTGAYHYVDAIIVTSLRYLQVPLAGMLAFILFEELMTMQEILGASIVIVSCFIIGWREIQYKVN
ncbi:MAG: DMT family transporter [Paracoccaceae bacterium]|nr:DMT family transporter [Paracoccaceae bacterium]